MCKSRRAVITGLGIVSPVGFNIAEYWSRITSDYCSIEELSNVKEEYLPFKYGSIIKNFDIRKHFNNPKLIRNLNRANQFAFLAADLALKDAYGYEGIAPEKKGLFFLTGMGQCDVSELRDTIEFCSTNDGFSYKLMGEKGMKLINPLLPIRSLPNTGLSTISIYHDFKGANLVGSPFETEAAMLMDEAIQSIATGESDMCLVGGADAPFSVDIMGNLVSLGRCNEHGANDLLDEIKLAEGAVFLVFEEAEGALQRGKKIYAFVDDINTGSIGDSGWRYSELKTAYESIVYQNTMLCDYNAVITADNGIKLLKQVEEEYWNLFEKRMNRNINVISYKNKTGYLASSSLLLDICHACFIINNNCSIHEVTKTNNILVCGVSLSQGITALSVKKYELFMGRED